MKQPRSRAGLRLLASVCALLAAALVIVACAPATPKGAPTAAQPAATQAAAPQATQPVAAAPTGSASAQQQDSQDPGPSLSKNPAAANTRHFQGDPNAPVVLIEVSDFQ